MGAEIWRTSTPASSVRRALTRPFETVSSSPSGLPMATTESPGRIASLSPSETTGSPWASTRRSARSCSGLAASTSRTSSSRSPRRSRSVTFTCGPPTMTCRLVAIQPSARTMKPVPRVPSVRIVTTAGRPWAAMSATESARGGGGGVAAAGGAAATFACVRGVEAQAAAQATRASRGSSRARIPSSVTAAAEFFYRLRTKGASRAGSPAIRNRQLTGPGRSNRRKLRKLEGRRRGPDRRRPPPRLPARLLRALHVDDARAPRRRA